MMGAYRQVRFQANPLTWLLLCLTGIMSIILVHSEVGGLCLAVFCIAIHLLTGHSDKAIPYSVCYLAFTGIAWGGVGLVESEVAFSVSSMLASLGVLGRKSIIPLSFAICLAKEPTGSLLASLQAMRLPKAVGIGLAVLLRFFPTIGGEYRAIRASQRFRGIGVGVVHTLTHLPSTVEYILIPLILRTIKAAEELSASMTVRGVRFSGETISYRPVRFTGKDAALCAMAVLIPAAVFLLERRGVF